jgi:hypothetical protein
MLLLRIQVPKESATLSSGHHERRIPVNANHSNMVKFCNKHHPRGRLILREIRLLAEKLLKVEAANHSESNDKTNTEEGKEPENEHSESAKRLEWDEVSVPSDESCSEDESASDIDQSPEPKIVSPSTTKQTVTFNFESAPKSMTGSSVWKPASTYYNYTCQACRPGKMCPAHCKDCHKERKRRTSALKLETPPISSNRLLLSWKPSDLCWKHRLEWTQFSGQPYPNVSFQWSTNPFLDDYASKYRPQLGGYTAVSPLLKNRFGLATQGQHTGFVFNPHTPALYSSQQKRAKEERGKKLEQQSHPIKADKPASSNQQSSLRRVSPEPKLNTTYTTPHNSKVSPFSYEAPAATPSYRSRQHLSPPQRPRTAVPSIRHIPSRESISSTSSSAQQSTLLPHGSSHFHGSHRH